jgi:hypothetical protein
MKWSEEQYADLMKRRAMPAPVQEPEAILARGRIPASKLNKTESAYAGYLDARKIDGDILWWRFEPMKLRLADGAYYRPDFGVLTHERLFEFREVKGFWREAARVRIKVAAEIFPFFKFIAIKRAKTGGWEREEF